MGENVSPGLLEPPFGLHGLIQFLKEKEIFLSKRRGQCFLFEKSTARSVTEHMGFSSNDCVVEVGGGLGHLSYFLSRCVKHLFIVEVDAKLAMFLRVLFEGRRTVSVAHQDVLKMSFDEMENNGISYSLAGNIPFGLSSPLLRLYAENMQRFVSATFVLPKDLVDSICAKPGEKSYRGLSVFCQIFFHVKILRFLSNNCFFPKPVISSALIRLTPRVRFCDLNVGFVERTLKALFSFRRKQLYSTLNRLHCIKIGRKETNDVFRALNLDAKIRVEALDVDVLERMLGMLKMFDLTDVR